MSAWGRVHNLAKRQDSITVLYRNQAAQLNRNPGTDKWTFELLNRPSKCYLASLQTLKYYFPHISKVFPGNAKAGKSKLCSAPVQLHRPSLVTRVLHQNLDRMQFNWQLRQLQRAAPVRGTGIAIVGAGPVGLMAAIFAKTAMPGMNVTVYERRTQYERGQVLVFQPAVLKILPDAVKQLWVYGGGCYVMPPRTDQSAGCYRQPVGPGTASATVASFEAYAKAYATSMGVHFRTDHITTMPVGHVALIAADGANSEVVNMLIGQGKLKRSDRLASYGLGIIFKLNKDLLRVANAQGRQYNDNKVRGALTIHPTQNRYRGFKTTSDAAYLGVQIAKSTYEELNQPGNAKKAAPLFWELPQAARRAIEAGMKFYRLYPDYKLLNSAKIFSFPVYLGYTTPAAAIEEFTKTPVYITGDALLRAHFFSATGVNAGIQSAKCAVDAIAANDDVASAFAAYEACVSPVKQSASQLYQAVLKNFDDPRLRASCNSSSLAQLLNNRSSEHLMYLPKQELCYVMADKLEQK